MTIPFDQARTGGNHQYPEGSEHEHWVFTFDNNRGVEIATDRADADFWWVCALRDGYPDPDRSAPSGLSDVEVEEFLNEIRGLPAFEGAEPGVPDDV